jgi:xanthine dehydrogenase YagS FAD-binding subunit
VFSVAAAVELENDALKDVRIALGGVAHVPWRAERAEAVLRGREPTAEAFAEAADAELEAARPLRDNAFKVQLARNVIVRTLSELTA